MISKVKGTVKSLLTYIFNFHNIVRFKSFGKNSYIGRHCITHFSRGGGVTIGSNVRFGNSARFSIYGPKAQIVIDDSVYAGTNVSIITADTVKIEKNVLLASYISIMGHNHGMNPESNELYGKQPLVGAPVCIKEGAWIGERVCVLPGVTIGKKSIIGSGSIVTKSIPDYAIAAGNPAKVLKQYNFETHKWERVS